MGLSAIVAVGGAEDKVDKRDILERFVLEAGGKEARIAILPTASEIPDERAAFYRQVFAEIGAAESFHVPIVTRAPQPPGLRRGTPLAEALGLVVEIEAVDHHRDVGLEGAAALEPAQDLVVVLDEPELDRGPEVLRLRSPEAASRADPGDDPLDQREFGEEELLASHSSTEDCPGGSMIRHIVAHRDRAGEGCNSSCPEPEQLSCRGPLAGPGRRRKR
jgi:hypothetical protein